MDSNRNTYGSILKAFSLFGGVKVFEIIIGIVRSKIIAVLLGPFGMGVSGLINSGVTLVSTFTGFSLGTSGVREVSKAYGSGDTYSINRTISVLRKLVWFTGILGTLVVLFFAEQLSIWSFKTSDYTLWFRLVSIVLLIEQLIVGQRVLMQGTFHYKLVAKTALFGNVISLIVTIPIYYIWGLKGIVPVIILSALTRLILSCVFARKVNYQKVKIPFNEIFRDGRVMLGLGFALAMSGTFTQGVEYLLRLFISNVGDVTDVGLYNAGISMATAYLGVILTSMGTDYAPRLSAASNDQGQFNEIINRQIELVLTIMIPLVAVFLVFVKEVVIILYSSKFLPIIGMIEWIVIGFVFRVISFCLSYAIVAAADAKKFLWNEIISNIYSLLFSAIGYKFFGFEGMGIAYLLCYLCYSVQMFLLCRNQFKFSFEKRAAKLMSLLVLLIIGLFITVRVAGDSIYRYILGCIGICIISYSSYIFMNQMINVKMSINGLFRKIFKSKL